MSIQATEAQAYRVWDLGLLLGKDFVHAVTRDMIVQSYGTTKSYRDAEVIIAGLEQELKQKLEQFPNMATLKQITYGMHLEVQNKKTPSDWASKTKQEASSDIHALLNPYTPATESMNRLDYIMAGLVG